MKNTTKSLLARKASGEKVSMLTAYDYTTAKIVDEAGLDMVLVGDSLGMTMEGYENTIPVTTEEMILYGRSVARACSSAFVIIDMPFMSYQISAAQALESAGKIMKETMADCVKLEGGKEVVPQIQAITAAGIPVCAHIGMTPQSVHAMGGFKVQGKGEENARRIFEDALAVEEAGAFAVVLECVPPKLAALITDTLHILTIGIGAGPDCDGQVLVYQDMLGLTQGHTPKFVHRFADIGQQMKNAFIEYDQAVKQNTFPSQEHSFVKSDSSDEFYQLLKSEQEGKDIQ